MRFEVTTNLVAVNDTGHSVKDIDKKTSAELVELNAKMTETKRLFLLELNKVQKAITDRLEIVNLAEAMVRNSDPEHAALAQSGNQPIDIVAELEKQLFQLKTRYPDRDIEGEVEEAKNLFKPRKKGKGKK